MSNDALDALDALFSENLHIHTNLSRCGGRDSTLTAVVRQAEKLGLRRIAVTDHIHPYETPKLFHNLPLLRRELAALDTDVEVLLGAELSAYGVHKYTLQYANAAPKLDFYMYAHNHYHMRGWEQPEDQSAEGYKRHCLQVLKTVIRSGKADALAHPFADKYIVREFEVVLPFTKGCITDLFTDNEIGDLMELGKDRGVMWELNTTLFADYAGFLRRYYRTGQEVGARFFVGSDAHRPEAMDLTQAKKYFKENIFFQMRSERNADG